ncbi:MAG: DNA polymerase III subunit delta [Janthinobacterium lividum]
MKLYFSQIDELIRGIKSNVIKSLLLYGPDKGYISEACAILVKEFKLISTAIEYSYITPQQLVALANRRNFFGNRELIKITTMSSSLSAEIKSLLNSEYYNLIIFIADELSAASTTRKHFEKESNLVSMACYHDDEKNIVKIILDKCHTEHKTISTEALDFSKVNLKGDYNLINTEIDKLMIYTKDKSHIDFEDTSRVVSVTIIASYDDLCVHFSQKNLEDFLKEISRLKHQNINEVSIIRSLIRYYTNFYIVLVKEEEGESLDSAIKSLSPAIFFKYVKDFKSSAIKITSSEVVKILKILHRAELDFKLNPHNFDFYQNIYYKAHTQD